MEHPEPMASGDVGIRSDPNLAMVELIAQALGPCASNWSSSAVAQRACC